MAEKKSDFSKGVAAGVGLLGAVAAGYFLYGPKGTQNRKKIRAWTVKAKGEILSEFEKMKDVSEEAYTQAIEKVTARYSKLKDIDPEEIAVFVGELKRHWKNIQRDLKPTPKKSAKKTTAKKK